MKQPRQAVNRIAIQELQTAIQTTYASKTVILLSHNAAERYRLTGILTSLAATKSILWISEFSANPTQQDIIYTLHLIADFEFRKILAIGGGSAIDLAKGVLAMYSIYQEQKQVGQDQELRALITKSIQNHDYSIPDNIELIAVPTTAGTGSEATSWATIWDYDHQAKYSIQAPELIPAAIYLIPELTLTLPKRITLATGLDALSHAMEAYWAKATNPDAQNLAKKAIASIATSLPHALSNPEHIDSRKNMLEAAYTAGLAFAQTKTTACHSISYPLTYLYGIEHGFAVAMTLPQIAEINKKEVPGIALLLQIFDPYGGLNAWLAQVTDNLVNLKLSNWGITEEDISAIVEGAFTKGHMDNNPVELSNQDIYSILMEVL